MEAVAPVANESCLCLHAVVDPNGLEQLDDPALLLVRHEDLACVARLVPSSEYADAQPENSHHQLEWLAPRAIEHHDLLLKLMCFTTVVPLKFGSLCGTVANAEGMLRDNYQKFRRLIDYLRSREEWSISFHIDKSAFLRGLELSEPSLGKLDELILTRSGGEAYLLQKKKQKRANELLAERLAALEQELHSRLGHYVADIVGLATSCKTDLPSRELVLSVAVLMSQEGMPAVEQELRAIESDYAEANMNAELCGPWPPYSFTTDNLQSASRSAQIIVDSITANL